MLSTPFVHLPYVVTKHLCYTPFSILSVSSWLISKITTVCRQRRAIIVTVLTINPMMASAISPIHVLDFSCCQLINARARQWTKCAPSSRCSFVNKCQYSMRHLYQLEAHKCSLSASSYDAQESSTSADRVAMEIGCVCQPLTIRIRAFGTHTFC